MARIAPRLAKRIVVTGRVQGVGYRAWAADHARELGLDGWVRNHRDGSVEALLAGEADDVTRMIEACRSGPGMARVEDVRVEDEEGDPPAAGFEVRPTA